MKKVILSLDGGGVRGVIEAMILAEIETRIQDATLNKYARLAEYCTLIAGTSTGGIIASLMALKGYDKRFVYSCNDIVDFYKMHSYDIFNASKRGAIGSLLHSDKYDRKTLDKLLDKYFGDDTLAELGCNVLIPTIDLITQEVVFFSNNKTDKSLTEFKVSDVCRATSAAPTYFDNVVISNGKRTISAIDGGLCVNDASMSAVSKVKKTYNCMDSDICLINIASGAIVKPLENPKSNMSLIKIATTLPLLQMYCSVGVVKYLTQQQKFGYHVSLDVPYQYRMYDGDMANASKENMDALITAAANTISYYDRTIEKIVKYLLKTGKQNI